MGDGKARAQVPGSNVSPEFEIDNKDGEAIVEVHSRQLDEEQAASLDTVAKELKKRHSEKLKEAKKSLAPRGIS